MITNIKSNIVESCEIEIDEIHGILSLDYVPIMYIVVTELNRVDIRLVSFHMLQQQLLELLNFASDLVHVNTMLLKCDSVLYMIEPLVNLDKYRRLTGHAQTPIFDNMHMSWNCSVESNNTELFGGDLHIFTVIILRYATSLLFTVML
ncbi:hypothetical protein BdWA1_000590 [Babesia duncani]|uniref:Uncharacterized protein n=1 Tax=Babesia duncani TaxID=323732 RepID=A0AAD9UPY6_9APIC|nr:hypothetical protein BdWA1_000590 [Babesia duncani]